MKQKRAFSVLDLTYISLFAVLMAICAWVAVPTIPPFTLQSFAVLLGSALLGWKRGLMMVLLYLLRGMLGLPVFSAFQAGPGVLLGPSGGYLLGFLLTAPLVGCFSRWGRDWLLLLGMLLGILVCSAFGTVWFVLVYSPGLGAVGWGAALLSCVLPFVLPDLAKIVLAFLLTKRLRKILP